MALRTSGACCRAFRPHLLGDSGGRPRQPGANAGGGRGGQHLFVALELAITHGTDRGNGKSAVPPARPWKILRSTAADHSHQMAVARARKTPRNAIRLRNRGYLAT